MQIFSDNPSSGSAARATTQLERTGSCRVRHRAPVDPRLVSLNLAARTLCRSSVRSACSGTTRNAQSFGARLSIPIGSHWVERAAASSGWPMHPAHAAGADAPATTRGLPRRRVPASPPCSSSRTGGGRGGLGERRERRHPAAITGAASPPIAWLLLRHGHAWGAGSISHAVRGRDTLALSRRSGSAAVWSTSTTPAPLGSGRLSRALSRADRPRARHVLRIPAWPPCIISNPGMTSYARSTLPASGPGPARP